MINMKNEIKRKNKGNGAEDVSSSFRSHSFTPNTLSFSFSSHAQELFRCNVPEEGKETRKERIHEEKKVKAHGKRGKGKGATE